MSSTIKPPNPPLGTPTLPPAGESILQASSTTLRIGGFPEGTSLDDTAVMDRLSALVLQLDKGANSSDPLSERMAKLRHAMIRVSRLISFGIRPIFQR